MADTHPVWDWTDEYLIGDAVRPSSLTVRTEEPVSTFLRQASGPQSTPRIRLGHAQPLEPRFDALPHGLKYTRASDTNERPVSA